MQGKDLLCAAVTLAIVPGATTTAQEVIASRHPFTLETWHMVMPFSSAFLVPIPLLFLHLKKRIVAGLTAGALK